MENTNVLYSGNELYHHGIKGMKWGVRRYQNKDGSLTPAGQKRRDKLQAKLDKIDGKESPKNSGKTSKKISDMTDEELSEYITRKNAEKLAYGLERDINQLNPKKVSAGEKFAADLKDRVLGPAAMEAGKKLMSGIMDKAVKKALGDDGADALSALKKEAEKAGYQQTIANAKKAAVEAAKAEKEANKKDIDDPELAARERDAKMADYDKRVSEARNAKAKAEWQEQVTKDLKNKSTTKDPDTAADRADNKSESTSSKSDNSETKTSTETSLAVYRDFNKSFGNDSYGSFKRDTSSQQKAGRDFIDAEWYNVEDDD